MKALVLLLTPDTLIDLTIELDPPLPTICTLNPQNKCPEKGWEDGVIPLLLLPGNFSEIARQSLGFPSFDTGNPSCQPCILVPERI
jgi:hypothetical protein